MRTTRRPLLAMALAAAFMWQPAWAPQAQADEPFITLASTTSTEQSGLFGALLPRFKEATGIEVHVVAVGTGQALELGRRGDADALLVHDKKAEVKLVDEGYGIDRRDVMYNDFVIVGPKTDPAGVGGMDDVAAALAKVAGAKAPFTSRGDDSGTNRAELRLWEAAGVDLGADGGTWYRELGQSMGPTLNTAAGMDAYAMTDRATWANFKNRQNLAILVEGDKRLFNQYGSILVDPARQPHVKSELAQKWHDWLTGPAGQKAIAAYQIGGDQLFFPNAAKAGS